MKKVLIQTTKLLKDSKWGIFAVTVIGLLMAGFLVSFFPTIKESGAGFEDYIDAFPPALAEIFGINSINITEFIGFISVEYYNFFWAIIFFPFIISWGTKLAKEAHSGTLALTLSYPISRSKIVVSNLFSILLLTIICSIVAVIPVMLFGGLIGEEIIVENWLKLLLMVNLILLFIGFLCVLLSSFLLRSKSIIFITAAIIIGGYFLGIMASLNEKFDLLKFFSIFYYFGEPFQILKYGTLNGNHILFLLDTIMLFALVSIFVVKYRDLPNG